MAKLQRGRLNGLSGMGSNSAAELFAWADKLELQIKDPTNEDDPKWLQRWANKMRKLAASKENKRDHKKSQFK